RRNGETCPSSPGDSDMLAKSKWSAAGLVVVLGVWCWPLLAAKPNEEQQRESAQKAARAGNYKDAYEALRKLALDPACDTKKVGEDLDLAVQCLRQLGRVDEVDDFREGVIAAHRNNWRLLQTAAQSYANVDHFGYIVAGKFSRGYKRGGGRFVSSMQRD